MAGKHGGYRKPANPAPVSGPGALSERTDGGPTQPVMDVGGFEYGGRQDFVDIQGGAPMAAAEPLPAPTPLFAPTERPAEPITAGAPVGPGPGPAQPPVVRQSISQRLAAMSADDESGQLLMMADILAARGL